MDTHEVDVTPPRITATGSRQPVWVRLPDTPPFGGADDETIEIFVPPAVPPAPAMPAAPPAPSRRRGGWLQTITAALLGAGLALVGFLVLDDDPPAAPAEVPAAAPAVVEPESPEPRVVETAPIPLPDVAVPDAVAIGEAVIPSIVTVQVGNGGGISGSGSGVIIDAGGLIVTNDHVIAAGTQYEVVLSDGRTAYSATLVGTDPLTDLAVLEIEADGLKPIVFGETSALRVGDSAVAVGSPLGLEGGPSLTVGVLSAFGRQVQVSNDDVLYGMLQTDAPITQGSSGGALVDARGRLIGITTAVGVSDVGVEGIGFATPIELVERVIDELISTGEIHHAFLGIFGGTSFADAADGASVAVGVQVSSVEPDTGAEAGGLQAGDLITALDGLPVTTMDDLVVALRYMMAGDDITLTVTGESGARTLDITLGERP